MGILLRWGCPLIIRIVNRRRLLHADERPATLRQGPWRKLLGRKGSMSLEAALIVPLLLTYFLALTTFIKLSVAEAGLRSAVTQSVHQLAVQAYPITLLKDAYVDRDLLAKLQQWHHEYEGVKEEVDEWVEEYGVIIPGPIRSAIEQLLQQAEHTEKQLTEPVRQAFRPLVAHYMPEHMDERKLTISALRYEVFLERGDPIVTIEATYDVLVRLPFYTRTVQLRATASEHVWTGRR